jgi:hypothetical protein
MRGSILSVITAVGISLLGTSGSFAAPAAGATIDTVALANPLAQVVRWDGHWGRWRGRGWGYRHVWGPGWGGRGWCYYHPYRCGWY